MFIFGAIINKNAMKKRFLFTMLAAVAVLLSCSKTNEALDDALMDNQTKSDTSGGGAITVTIGERDKVELDNQFITPDKEAKGDTISNDTIPCNTIPVDTIPKDTIPKNRIRKEFLRAN